ncbi:hypothetical protein HF862_06440 [Fusobacterium sp. FSA-380-WT-3A]|nr:hypothetical protein [Fusobacterium sp. FSA-380-WT-3A]
MENIHITVIDIQCCAFCCVIHCCDTKNKLYYLKMKYKPTDKSVGFLF